MLRFTVTRSIQKLLCIISLVSYAISFLSQPLPVARTFNKNPLFLLLSMTEFYSSQQYKSDIPSKFVINIQALIKLDLCYQTTGVFYFRHDIFLDRLSAVTITGILQPNVSISNHLRIYRHCKLSVFLNAYEKQVNENKWMKINVSLCVVKKYLEYWYLWNNSIFTNLVKWFPLW